MAKLSDPENSRVPKYMQAAELDQECKELIPTLPLEKGWITSHFHQYQGFWLSTRILQGTLSCHKQFQAIDTDILIVTTPKSGTTWLKALTFALLNRDKYPIIDHTKNNHPLLTTNPHGLVPFLESDLYYKDFVPDVKTLSSSRLFSPHLSYELLPKSVKESTCKVVYLCRDPKDNFVSLWHFTNKLRAQSRGTLPLQEAFGPFWEHVLVYWKKSLERPKKVMFLKYEEMKMKPNFYLKELAEFLGCPFSKEEEFKGLVDDILNLCSFEKLSNLEVNKTGKGFLNMENKAFFRLGNIGDWKNHLTTEMVEQINTITEEKFVKHGLCF